MTTIVTRSGKGSPLTHTEVDTNFTNLNTAKLETAAIPLGTLQAPSVSFLNDSDTGIFCPQGGNSLAIATGGQYAITCTSTQAVGIKTANPSTALHVAGNARVGADDVTDAHLQIGKGATGNRNSYIDIVGDTTYTDYGLRVIRNNTGANATSELKHRGTGALNFTTQEAAAIVFNTTNSPALTITSGGLVGIGTTGPTSALTVNGSISTVEKQNAIFGVDIATSSGNGGDLTVKAGNGSGSGNSSGNLYLGCGRGGSSAANGFMAFGLAQATNTNGLAAEYGRFDTSGRLLVGTDTAFTDGFNSALTSSQLSKGSDNNVRCISDTRSVAAVNNSTVDAWVGRKAAGTAFAAAMAGHFYVQVGGADAFSGVYSIVSSSLGTSSATLTAVSTVTRGTSPVSSVQIANDGAGGAIKLTITYINNAGVVGGLISYVSFVGLAG